MKIASKKKVMPIITDSWGCDGYCGIHSRNYVNMIIGVNLKEVEDEVNKGMVLLTYD